MRPTKPWLDPRPRRSGARALWERAMTGVRRVTGLPPMPGGLLAAYGMEPSPAEECPRCPGPIEEEPAGYCCYGDGWADPAIIVRAVAGGTGPGWARYAHPECAERAAAGGALEADVALLLGTRLRVWGADR